MKNGRVSAFFAGKKSGGSFEPPEKCFIGLPLEAELQSQLHRARVAAEILPSVVEHRVVGDEEVPSRTRHSVACNVIDVARHKLGMVE